MSSKVGESFHASFKLQRKRLAEVIGVATEYGEVTKSSLVESGLGKNMIPAFMGWGQAVGLLGPTVKKGSLTLTPLGKWMVGADNDLASLPAQWLMHLNLVMPSSPAPDYFRDLFLSYMTMPHPISPSSAEDELRRLTFNSRTDSFYGQSSSVILGTYRDMECLGGLNILKETGNQGEQNSLAVSLLPAHLSVETYLVCLMLWWRSEMGDVTTIPETAVTNQGGLMDLLRLSPGDIDQFHATLRHEGAIDLYRVAPPYQIVRHWDDSDEALWDALDRMPR